MMKNDGRHESGAIFIEACVVIPLLMVVLFVFVSIINMFIVHSYVQYGLNQAVNEVGNYTMYLHAVGLIEWDRETKAKLNTAVKEGWSDIEQFGQTYSDVMDAVGSVQDTANDIGEEVQGFSLNDMEALVSGISDTKSKIDNTKGKVEGAASSVKKSWGTIQKYLKDPAKLLMFLKNQGLTEIETLAHTALGAFIGKGMMYRYVHTELLEGLGVVGIDYNGTKMKDTYNTGIDGMCFWQSSFLNDTDSRVIRLNTIYRIKYPVNVSKLLPGVTDMEGSPLYENSFCIEQEAIGYGWMGGDNSGKGEYNKNK